MDDAVFDRSLLERIRTGDKAACSECIARYGDSVYRLALRLSRDEQDAEDIVQETFLNAFKAIDTFQGAASLSTWLYRIAYNAAMMRHRTSQPSVSIEDTLDEGLPVPEQFFDWCCLPEQEFQTQEVRAQLEQALDDLPESLRGVFVLRELEGLSGQETAEVLQISIDVVKQRLHRARLWLRERLSTYFNERVSG